MAEKVMLELPEAMLRRAQATAKRTGRDYRDILTAWLARGAEYDVEALIKPDVEYPVYTPFGNEGAAQVLLDALKAHQAGTGAKDKEDK